jgi:hypothetical protein
MVGTLRLLALDARLSKLGFAVFEGPTDLLDWGTQSFENGHKALRPSFLERFRVLLAFFEPTAIVIRKRNYHLHCHKRIQAVVISIIKSELRRIREAKKLSVVTPKQVQKAFAKNGEIFKHDIALRVTDQFQELAWKLPRRRKTYESEPTAMIVFDAIATGITYFRRHARSRLSAPSKT